jgi:hypothetical protein
MSDDPKGKPYQHSRYRPGLNVYIEPTIREIYPLSPIAGQVVRTCEGIEYETLALFEDQTVKVPVVTSDGRMFYVEEEYVRID